MLKKMFFIMFLIIVLVGCTTQMATQPKDENMLNDSTIEKTSEEIKNTNYIDVSPIEAKQLIEETEDLTIIDVSPRYAEGHLPNAINYYVGDGSLDKAIPQLDKTKTYLVYCHVDSASILGAQKLIDAGFEMVYRLKGNYKGWVDAGYEIKK